MLTNSVRAPERVRFVHLARRAFLVILGVALPAFSYAQTDRWYVDAASSGSDGLSWPAAFNDLQDALDEAALEGGEIWVANGTYYPSAQTDPNEPRSATFSLISGVGIYGGFRGPDDSDPNNPYPGESELYERNPERHETILSGNIDSPSSTEDNCWHVVTADNTGAGAVLSGFTIRDGNGEGTLGGGGMHTLDSEAIISRCTFRDNVAPRGGAMRIVHDNEGTKHNLIVNCRFLQNTSSLQGGAIITIHGIFTAVNCLFADNTAGRAGGAVFVNETGEYPTLINCTFARNKACDDFCDQEEDGGGAVFLHLEESGAALITNCVFWDNSPDQILDTTNHSPPDLLPVVVSYSDVQDGWTGDGTNNIDADPLFCNPTAGIFRLDDGSPCIDLGDNAAVPADDADVDDDPSTTILPWDLPKSARIYPPESGTVDIGAYENPHNQDCAADLDGNGSVGIEDLALMMSCFGQPAEGACSAADLDCSGDVGLQDLAILLSAYGTCGGEGFAGFSGDDGEAEFFAWAQNASIEELMDWYDGWRENQP